ncbi:MAG: transposase [Thermodesulfobacteriota bacterium]|nr:transposase [Thermodesulfobacteriota bacterium]
MVVFVLIQGLTPLLFQQIITLASLMSKIEGFTRKSYQTICTEYLFELAHFKEDLAGVVVESTFNWYWLVDGLQEKGYTVHLANPSAIKQYEGLKYVDDRWDSFWLAHLLRLNILPEGYIYPKEERPLRDLLRRRLLFVRQRASHNLSLQSMITRNVGYNLCSNEIKKKYLSWAYVEAAHFAKIHCAHSKSFYHRKKMKTNTFVATKALSNKLARASYYIMRDQVPYDPVKLFG